jgi:hypothetical protein
VSRGGGSLTVVNLSFLDRSRDSNDSGSNLGFCECDTEPWDAIKQNIPCLRDTSKESHNTKPSWRFESKWFFHVLPTLMVPRLVDAAGSTLSL